MQSGELFWWFSDTGKGITADQGTHIFDPFFCGRQAGRGLGLGLPRAARIVELAGGRLKWSSDPGQGTLFQVHLPLPVPPEPNHHPLPPGLETAVNGTSTPRLPSGHTRQARSRTRA